MQDCQEKHRVITDYLDAMDSILQTIEESIFPLSKTALQMSSNSILKDLYNMESIVHQ